MFQANDIILKLQGELQELLAQSKVKNSKITSQEKLLKETEMQLQRVQKDFQNTQEMLASKKGQVGLERSSQTSQPHLKQHSISAGKGLTALH